MNRKLRGESSAPNLHSVHPRDKGVACAIFVATETCPVVNCPYLHVTKNTRRPIPTRMCPHYAVKRCLRDDCLFYHQPQQSLEMLRASRSSDYCPLDGMPIRDPLGPLPYPLLAAGELTGARPLTLNNTTTGMTLYLTPVTSEDTVRILSSSSPPQGGVMSSSAPPPMLFSEGGFPRHALGCPSSPVLRQSSTIEHPGPSPRQREMQVPADAPSVVAHVLSSQPQMGLTPVGLSSSFIAPTALPNGSNPVIYDANFLLLPGGQPNQFSSSAAYWGGTSLQ